MYRVFNIALLVGLISLACSQSSVGALNLGHGVPAEEIAIEYELEEFNQQANFQNSTTERIGRKDHPLNMVTEVYSFDRGIPLPFPEPIPAPPVRILKDININMAKAVFNSTMSFTNFCRQ